MGFPIGNTLRDKMQNQKTNKLRRRNSERLEIKSENQIILKKDEKRFKDTFDQYILKEDTQDFIGKYKLDPDSKNIIDASEKGKVNSIAILIAEDDKDNPGQSERDHKKVKDLLSTKYSVFKNKIYPLLNNEDLETKLNEINQEVQKVDLDADKDVTKYVVFIHYSGPGAMTDGDTHIGKGYLNIDNYIRVILETNNVTVIGVIDCFKGEMDDD